MKPRVCVLKTDGVNCEAETAYAFDMAGGEAATVHINALREGTQVLRDFQILALPGGFSYGDDVASGRILAIELISQLGDQIQEFARRGGLVIGICNGFQILVKTGLLPSQTLGQQAVTLTNNLVGHFRCAWVKLYIEKGGPCVFTTSLQGQYITLPVANGEGNFVAPASTLEQIEEQGLVVARYSDGINTTNNYPANPSGSSNAIAGICDATGRIFGLMPHPERFVVRTQYGNWRRENIAPHGIEIFRNAVQFFA